MRCYIVNNHNHQRVARVERLQKFSNTSCAEILKKKRGCDFRLKKSDPVTKMNVNLFSAEFNEFLSVLM